MTFFPPVLTPGWGGKDWSQHRAGDGGPGAERGDEGLGMEQGPQDFPALPRAPSHRPQRFVFTADLDLMSRN